ncbi:hypothetical protein B0A55_03194 [Friedmanniomyces simplex]|uniref:Pentacotripeptide-repeat region of PRORP domain-containing protein n=1 Tax=Friedmanniomyces simplex TaxID=329884 RepID=A0A4U0XLL4_9PEZI|nr:hypothetical protein B0A55_03194 [Friedmanniomyces simplex]
MPPCSALIRSALHGWPVRVLLHLHASQTTYSPQWHTILSNRSRQRSYTTALAERQHDEPSDTLSGDTAYLDFLLSNDEDGLRSSNTPRQKPKTFTAVAKSWKDARRARESFVRQNKQTTRRQVGATARAQVRARYASRDRGKHLTPTESSVRSDVRTSAVFSSLWNIRYTGLARRYDRGLPEHYLEPPTALPLPVDAFERIDEVLDHMDSTPDGFVWSLKIFAQRYGKLEREIWSETALWLLCYDKPRLEQFLLATHAPLYPPINWVEDCLQVLARHYITSSQMDHETRTMRFCQLVQTFLVLLDRQTKERFVFSSSFVRLLLPYCTDAQANEIWASIKLGKVKVHSNTILHFAAHFVKHGQLDESLEALLDAEATGAKTKSVAFRSACSTLLRRSSSHQGGIRTCLRLVELLGNLGVKLDTRMYNIVMLNAIDAGDIETANNLYRAMLEQGRKPSQYTCAIRLKACKLDIDNAVMLRDVIQDAIRYGNVRTDPLVSGEILHCLALHHVKHNPSTAFATLAAAYTQFFEPAPLELLSLKLPNGPSEEGETSQQRMQPPRHAITYMLLVYLDHIASSQEAIDLYTRWRQLVESGHEILADCATTPHVSNVFLRRFTRQRRTLPQTAQVIKDMQTPLPPAAGVKQAPPDLYTWSIFMQGFVERGETKLAEQVLSYMRSKGMKPDHVTWTSLISGYATSQDAEGLVDVIRRADASGDVWDEWTQKGVQQFNDKLRLKKLLERQGFEKRMDFSQDIKGTLAGRLMGETVGEGERAGHATRADGWGSVQPEESGMRPPNDEEGFADSSAELAELAGTVRQV